MIAVFTGVAALVPSILLVVLFRSRDEHPEPSGVLWATFFLGIASILPTLVVALPLGALLEKGLAGQPLALGAVSAFATAAFPEELFKLAVLLGYCARHKAFDEPMDGVIYGVVGSLGFATFENVLYVFQGGLGVAIMRALTAVPMHAFCGAVMGYYVARWRFPQGVMTPDGQRGGAGLLFMAWFVPFLFHGVYDAPLLAFGGMSKQAGGEQISNAMALGVCGGLIVVLFALLGVMFLGIHFTRVLRAEQLGSIAAGHYEVLAAQAVDEPPAPQRDLWSWLLLISGMIVGGFGSLIGLVVVAGVAQGGPNTGALIAGGAILGGPALLLGIALFFVGLRRLPQPAPRRVLHG